MQSAAMTALLDQDKADYKSRFQELRELESQRDGLVQEVIDKLDTVTLQLETVTRERARDIAVLERDLESEKDARRRLQDKNAVLGLQLSAMEQARFVLVLIDADADIYLFDDVFLCGGSKGGQKAADRLIEKVREYLLSLDDLAGAAETVPVVIKAYANLSGLAQACVRDKKLSSVSEMVQFWIGFSRRHHLVDFVDVGAGKEEADNKLRETLGFHIGNPQCQHVLLACCHDAGYVPVLRRYAAQPSSSQRVTLISSGVVQQAMTSLGFKTTRIFESLFGSSANPSRSLSPSGNDASNVGKVERVLDQFANSTSTNPSSAVSNSGRLRPVLRNSDGRRVDKVLSVEESVVNRMKKLNLCNWHYLRANCVVQCPRNHQYPRPLSTVEYDAQWRLARQGLCRVLRKGRECLDDQCVYSHGSA